MSRTVAEDSPSGGFDRAALYAGLVALATPVGGAIAVLATHGLKQDAIGTMLAIAAGSFLYVAASDLIPEAHAAKHALTGVLLLAGVVTVWGVMRAFGLH